MIKYIRQPDEAGFLQTCKDEDFPPPKAAPVQAVTAFAAIALVMACGRTEDVPPLFGVPEIEQDLNLAAPAPAPVPRAFTADDDLPVAAPAFAPDEDYWDPPIPWAQPRVPLVFEIEDEPAGSLYGCPDADEVRRNWVPPVPAPLGRVWLPDPEEIPAGTLFGVPEEDRYAPPVPWGQPRIQLVPDDEVWAAPASTPALDEDAWLARAPSAKASARAFRDDDVWVPPAVVTPIQDEDFWHNGVPPVQAATFQRLPFLPDPEEIPAGNLTVPKLVYTPLGPTNEGHVPGQIAIIGPTRSATGATIAANQLEVLSTRAGMPPWVSATGSLTANTGQVITASRAASAYCLGDDGLLHFLGPNTARVEPVVGLLVEGAATNTIFYSQPGNTTAGAWAIGGSLAAAPAVTLNSTDVLDPTGANTATKCVFPASVPGGYSVVYTPNNVPANSTLSVYLRTLSGTATVYLTDFAHVQVACAVTSTWQRFQVAGATTYLEIGWDQSGGLTQPTSGGTVYAWGAQAELTPFATSLIPTTGAPASRDADLLSVSNPLAGLSQPVALWRMEAVLTPLGPWASLPNFGTLSALALYNGTATNQADFFGPNALRVLDGAGVSRTCTTSAPTGSSVFALQALDTSTGLMSTTPAGTLAGAGTGIVSTMPGTLYLGIPPWAPTFGFWGHMTDIVLDNRASLPTTPPTLTVIGPSTPRVYGPSAMIGPTKGS